MSYGPEELEKRITTNEYWRRNFRMQKDVWEGLSWVLDLLPTYPKDAIRSIDSYFLANCPQMTDWQINGIGDCTAIIRARYFDIEHPNNLLLEIDPEEFEWLIEALYIRMGYSTQLTSKTNDGGIDIIANKDSIGKKEKSFIQCKRYKSNIGSPAVRDLLGAVSNGKATKGVLISTSEFTNQAIKFADDNPSIELLGYKQLNKLLNIHLSPEWPVKMDRIFRKKKQALPTVT